MLFDELHVFVNSEKLKQVASALSDGFGLGANCSQRQLTRSKLFALAKLAPIIVTFAADNRGAWQWIIILEYSR